MNQFNIVIHNKPGALAHLCEKISVVNIEAIASERAENGKTLIKIVTNDESTARKILQKEHIDFDEGEIFVLKLPDRPGELAKAAKKLANTGISMNSIYILGKKNGLTEVAITTDNMRETRKILRNSS